MLIKNAKLRNNDNLVDILIKDGVITKIDSNIEVNNDEIIDAKGFLVIPPFIEPHIHLDTTLTAGEPKWNESGTLFEGIERWSERKEFLTIEDVKTRARKAITWQVANGIQFIRTHVDTTDCDKSYGRTKRRVKRLCNYSNSCIPSRRNTIIS